jgi:DNA repair protein RecN (Recombination protein N)
MMLALKTVIAARASNANARVRTLIFDEVDAGIGGRAAEVVGERLKRLARENQVLSVTHLPQIACFADHHYSVEKVERAGRTFTSVQYLATERERATELARMLSGRRITEAVLEHATAMLKQGSRR